MSGLDVKSVNKLSACHPLLWDLFQKVAETEDLVITCGHRGEEEQNALFPKYTRVQWPDSKHNSTPSNAVDATPRINGAPELHDREAIIYFAGKVMLTAKKMGIPIRWGGDWNKNNQVRDEKFQDLFHYEICLPDGN